MKKLNIDWSDLELAFETFGSDSDLLSEHYNYFDLETGRVVFMTDDLSRAVAGSKKNSKTSSRQTAK